MDTDDHGKNGQTAIDNPYQRDHKNPVAPTIAEASATETLAYKSKKFICAGYNWFCGYDTGPDSQRNLQELDNHLHLITTLQQSVWERRILFINTIIIFIVVLFVYIFFSVYTPALAEHYKPDWLKEIQNKG